MNSVNLTGRMTREAELKYLSDGKGVASFTIAVNRGYSKDADFIKVTVWDKQAENLVKYTKKGSQVEVEGSIRTGSYEKDGKRVYTTEVQATRIGYLDSKGTNSNNDDVEDVFGMSSEEIPF